ncbi:MAG: ATP synthase F0 subunit A [Actinobacteria bacterium]|nr:ATP synthase F0 subunit A [Actinomycetota bacterium]
MGCTGIRLGRRRRLGSHRGRFCRDRPSSGGRQLPDRRRHHHPSGEHLAECPLRSGPVRLPRPPRCAGRYRGGTQGQRRLVRRRAVRHHPPGHPPGPPCLGDQARLCVAGLSRPGAPTGPTGHSRGEPRQVNVLALEFPPVSHLFEWPDIFFSGTAYAVNKTALIYLAAVVITGVIFTLAGRPKASLVPAGIQHVAESGIDFIEDSVVMQTIGPEGRKFMPFLTTMFFFIMFSNIFEVIPGVQFPANSRMAVPITLAIVVWVIYNFVGIRSQGLGGYLKNSLFPPGVPVALYLIVTPIELVSTFVVRPFSLAIRLWANMVAGHLLLVTFAVLTQVLWSSTYIGAVGPFAMLVLMTGFEILVSVLQAFIFTILTAVYIGGSMHPAH